MVDLRMKLSHWGVMIVRGVTEGGGRRRQEGLEVGMKGREGGKGEARSMQISRSFVNLGKRVKNDTRVMVARAFL